MVLLPTGGLGRLLLVIIVVTTIAYLVLNLVSFGGNRWISYTDVPVRFGLWRVCDTTTSGLCNYWTQSFASNVTSSVFNSEKPSFIRSAQGLEIVSLIFYVFAVLFIIVGFLNIRAFPYQVSFGVAAGLLFLAIIFLSAALGVMSTKGRDNHPGAFLDWAWWNGLVGLIMTIICCFSLIAFIVYMKFSLKPLKTANQSSELSKQKNIYPSSPPPMLSYPTVESAHWNTWAPPPRTMPYVGQSNPLMNVELYSQQQQQMSPSPLVTELFREIVSQRGDARYERQLLEPFEQYALANGYALTYYL